MGIRDAIEELVASFNRGSLDVPSGLFTPRTTFSLNNRSYESMLGGSPDDPLIRLLARGAAGYRTAAKALQYSLQQSIVTIEHMTDTAPGLVTASVRVEGQLRVSAAAFACSATLRFRAAGAEAEAVEITCDEADLAKIAESRRA